MHQILLGMNYVEGMFIYLYFLLTYLATISPFCTYVCRVAVYRIGLLGISNKIAGSKYGYRKVI